MLENTPGVTKAETRNPLGKTELYAREQNGVKVVASVEKQEVELQAATDTTPAVTKEQSDYSIVGTYNDEQVAVEVGPGYRQTVARARKLFKELHDVHAKPILEAEKEKVAKEKADAKAKREEEKAQEAADKAAKAKEKAEELALKATEAAESKEEAVPADDAAE